MVFVAVTSLFHTFSDTPHVAGAAAADIFHRFDRIHLCCAAVAVLATATWVALDAAGRFRRVLLVVPLCLAAGAALTSTLAITPRIDNLRQNNLVDTPAFKKLHGTSMAVYLAESASLLAAGLLLPGAIGFAATVFHIRDEPR
jgi:hypothetical protein